MNENSVVSLRQKDEIDDPLTEILRAGARKLIVQAVEIEFDTFLALNARLVLPDGRQRVVRHGHDPVRTIQTGIGPVEVQKPKARDRAAPAAGERIRFASAILPKWARRTKSLDALLPALYLRGISAGDFQEVLTALLGKDAPNLSPAVIARLKGEWEDEYQQWQKRDLSAAAMSTSGQMAFICRRGWSHRPNACFRNGPLSVESLVSTSPIFGAPCERALHSAVASAAPVIPVRRLRRRRRLASVRGRRDGRHMMPSEETASLSSHAWSVWMMATARTYGFTGSIVPATGPRMKRTLVRTASKSLFRSRSGARDLRRLSRASFVQRKLVPSIHIRCRMTPSLRAKATLARFIPRRLATSIPQRFSAEKRVTRDNKALAAS